MPSAGTATPQSGPVIRSPCRLQQAFGGKREQLHKAVGLEGALVARLALKHGIGASPKLPKKDEPASGRDGGLDRAQLVENVFRGRGLGHHHRHGLQVPLSR